MNKWDKRFMELAKQVSTWSKDRSTGVGAVIVNDDKKVLSLGFNGFPRGVNDDVESRHTRPEKNHFVTHAERNALDEAETSLKGATIYCTFFTCSTCAHGIIQKGLSKVVAPEPDWDAERYAETQRHALQMYKEAGVEVQFYNDDSKKDLIAFWKINCSGGQVEGIITSDNFNKFMDNYLHKMKLRGQDATAWVLDKDVKAVKIYIGKKDIKHLYFGKYEANEFIFDR